MEDENYGMKYFPVYRIVKPDGTMWGYGTYSDIEDAGAELLQAFKETGLECRIEEFMEESFVLL
jgi:hypothetical protein